jgi:multiple sugar transport system substrate-binding protein
MAIPRRLLPTVRGRKLDQDWVQRVGSDGGHIMRRQAIVLATALAMAPLGAQAADLVVWWEKGFYAQEDEAVAEIVAAFEQETGKQVELVQPEQDEIFDKAQDAIVAGKPPDFLVGTWSEVPRWAYEDRLVDLDGVLAPVLDLFDADTIEVSMLLNGSTGERGLYALPMGRTSQHVHVWASLLERAGLSRDDIPKEWEPFWSFWCDRVQPAVRKALGREDIWGIGLPMSAEATDTDDALLQFELARGTPWLDLDRRPQFDRPEIRGEIIEALSAYTLIWRKGCTPPDSTNWANIDNNKAFLTQSVVMTTNQSLSIPSALNQARPDDYYRNAATIDWPNGLNGQPLVIVGSMYRGAVFKDGRNPDLAGRLANLLAEEGWLAHWLDFAGDRYLPPMRKLVEQPFWLDPTDPHRMRAAIQIMTRPHLFNMDVRDHERQSGPIWDENVWGNAVHRVVADGISPEQAVDEAIARIKQILSE